MNPAEHPAASPSLRKGLLDGSVCPDCDEATDECQAKANVKGACWRWNESHEIASSGPCEQWEAEDLAEEGGDMTAASANLNEDGLGRGLPRAADTGASGPAPSPDKASAETSRDVAWSHPSRGITGDLGGPLPKPSSAAQPHVGEWWRTPDGILWRVDGVGKRTVKLSTSRSYGVMKATAHRADFVRRSKRETVDA